MADSRPDIRGLEQDAYGQGGYFTTAQARDRGVSSELLIHHLKRGRFERIRRGLYRLAGFPTSEHDEMREKWMAVGADRAMLSHESALELLGLSDNIPRSVHLLVPRRHRGLRKPPGTTIHTYADNEEPASVWRHGMRLTAPARTIVEAADQIQPEQAEMAVREAIQQGLLTERQLRDEARSTRKRSMVEALLDRSDGA